MQIKNANVAFKPVTVTFETSAEYEAFRAVIYRAVQELNFNDKVEEVANELYDAVEADNLDN